MCAVPGGKGLHILCVREREKHARHELEHAVPSCTYTYHACTMPAVRTNLPISALLYTDLPENN